MFTPCACVQAADVSKSMLVDIKCPNSKTMADVVEKINAEGIDLPSFEALFDLAEKPQVVTSTTTKAPTTTTSKATAPGSLAACPVEIEDVHSCKAYCVNEGYRSGQFHH